MTLRDLTTLQHAADCKKTSMRPDYVVKVKFTDNTANGLTKAVIAALKLHGCQAERVSVEGRVIDTRQRINGRLIGEVKRIPSSGSRGSADVSSTIPVTIGGHKLGISVKWEIKMKDDQSPDQVKYQEHIEQSGGHYFIVRSFEDFWDKYQLVINKYR